MNGALVLPSQFPNGPKLAAQRIDTVAKEARSVDQADMDELRQYFKVVSMRDPSWNVKNEVFYTLSEDDKAAWAVKFAGIFSQDFTYHSSPSFYAGGKVPVQCFGMPDIEYHSNRFMVEFIKAFRRLRNARIIYITLESMQGGWMEPDLILLINSDPNIYIVPQAYGDQMQKFDTAAAVIDLLKRGLKWEKIQVFHSLRGGLPSPWWGGWVFLEDWGQLP